MKKAKRIKAMTWGGLLGGSLFLAASAQAGMVIDSQGNEGYDTAAECDAAVASGKAKFYQPFTDKAPRKRAGEAEVLTMKLSDLAGAREAASRLGYDAAAYARGACDLGVGRSHERDGVSRALIGKYVPFSPEMPVNVYKNQQGEIVRATMKRCDNNFSNNLPRPTGSTPIAAAASECFATVMIPARFETRTERVVKEPATKRFETIPATYKTVTEQVLVTPEYKRQIPVPATYKTVAEEVVVKPAGFREEPVPATYKMVAEQVLVKPESKRIEIIPATYKTATEQVMVTPERRELRVIPAEYGEKEETVVDRPATTRVETVPATYRTETERVLVKAESVSYEPIELPLRQVTERVVLSEGSKRIEASKPTLRTVTERVLVKEASTRLVEVPAVFETVTERVKVADATKEWKRGSAWIGKAIDVRPVRSFSVGRDGRVDGAKVESQWQSLQPNSVDDDVMCLVEIPEQYQTITRQVLKSPATVRRVEVPAEYATITRQVIDTQAAAREIDIPATYQTVTRQEIDVEKLRAMGFRLDDRNHIVATNTGERVLRVADLQGYAGYAPLGKSGAAAAAAASKVVGAGSGFEGYVREVRTPAEYRTVTRQVVDKEAAVRMVEVPATYKTVKTRVVTKPARTEEVVIPATYRTVERQVIDTPASTREITVPAEYRTVERRVIDTPATTRKIPVAAVTETIKRQVIDQPATFREEVVPAVYRTETRKVIDQPATMREIEVPAKYETLSYQVKVVEASTERRSILCEANATPAKIMEIQRALLKAGYNPGPVNGVLRATTMSAVNRYQQARGLPVDGYLNLETVKALGVNP